MTKNTYDQYGRPTSLSSPQGVTLTYGDYDPASRPTALTWAMGGQTHQESLTYTEGGALSRITLPAGEVAYDYNEQGRLAHAEAPTGSYYNFFYDSRGLPDCLTLPGGGEIEYTYTADARTSGITLTPNGTVDPSASLSYSYDAYGKVDGMTRQMEITDPASGTYAYGYDRLGRLTEADGPGDIPTYAYTYDARGPVSQKTETPAVGDAAITAYTYDAAGRLRSDSAGNSYAYDAAGRLTSATEPRGLSSLAYDGLSRLVSAVTPSGETSYAYDGLGRMLARQQTQGETTEFSLLLPFAQSSETAGIYESADGENFSLALSFISDPAGRRLSQTDYAPEPDIVTYPFRSPRGDVLALTDGAANLTRTYAYEPYGEMEDDYSEAGTPFLYQDDYRDPATDLYQMQARWYDPQSALFTSQDPALGDATDPMLRYPYAYCGGGPVYNSDPSGKRLIEGEDESGRMVTWAPTSFLQSQARRYGDKSVGAYMRRIKQQRQERINQIRAQAMAELAANPPTVPRYIPTDPNGDYIGSRNPSPFQPDFDWDLWHYCVRDLEPNGEDYPNTYTEWEAVPQNTSSRDWKCVGFTLSALFLTGSAAVAYYVGQQAAAGELGAAAIEVTKEAVSYAQPVGLAWNPYYYAPKEGEWYSSIDPGAQKWVERPEGPTQYYAVQRFKDYFLPTDTVPYLPPGTRIIVYQGIEIFLNPESGDPYNVRAYAYPPLFVPNETRVLEDMATYPSFIVQQDGSYLQVNR